jgi:TRAP-type uncharacterized transport system fused permease subunit
MEESRDEVQKEIEKEMEKEVEKRVTNWVTVAITVFVTVAVMFVISLVVFRFVWGWVVPDLFPGAVDQGLIVADLTWLSAFKLAVLVAVLSGFYPALTDAFKQRP